MSVAPRINVMKRDAEIAAEIEDARAAGEPWATRCLNCDSPLKGHFCSSCGQRVVPPNPTVHELAGEAFAEFSGWDGKVAATARLLIRKPGALTCEYLAGRRARYIQPVRLYLTFSVAFFLLAASSPNLNRNSGFSIRNGVSVGKANADVVTVPLSGDASLTPDERKKVLAQVATAPWYIRPMIRRVSVDAKGFQHDVFEAMPKGLFALLPVFAGILALFFWRRHFTEHLYFALHLHAFAFLALTVNELVKFTHSLPLSGLAGVVALLWIVVYAHFAFRRVYGNSHLVTLVKELGIAALYIAAAIPAIIGVALWASRG
jgi:hypothetical protein